jgi:hypothetical protein
MNPTIGTRVPPTVARAIAAEAKRRGVTVGRLMTAELTKIAARYARRREAVLAAELARGAAGDVGP